MNGSTKGSAKNAAGQASQASDSSAGARQCILLFGDVPLWTPEVRALIEKSMPHVKILTCSDEKDLARRLTEFDLVMIFCQTRSDPELIWCFAATQAARHHLRYGLAIVTLITGHPGHPQIELLEKKGVIQTLKPTTTAKAFRIKVEYSFSRMKATYAEFQKKYGYDFRLKLGEGEGPPPSLLKGDANREKPALVVVPNPPSGADSPDLIFIPHEDAPASPWNNRIGTKDGDGKSQSRSGEEESGSHGTLRIQPVEDVYSHLVLISSREADMAYVAAIAQNARSNFHLFSRASTDIQQFLARYPRSVVFWDVDHEKATDSRSPDSIENVGLMLSKVASPSHVFAVSDQMISKLPYLFNFGRHVFTHNVLRRHQHPAIEIYSRLVESVLNERPFGLDRFFRGGSRRQTIHLTQSSHRLAAIEATRNFLTKQGLPPRLAGTVSHAADELLLNAIFDAPVNERGERYRRELERSADFPFSRKEEISLSVMSNEHYFGLSINDQFGSLKLDSLLSSLQQDFQSGPPAPVPTAFSGLGLKKVVESGFSLLLASIAGEATEAALFFPKARNHKEFKSQFRFLSAIWADLSDSKDST